MSEPGSMPSSPKRVWTATITAAIVAALILWVVIWPSAEVSSPAPAAAPPEVPPEAGDDDGISDELAAIMSGNIRDAEPGSQTSQTAPFRFETVRIPLAELEEVEFKAHMAPGDTLLYSWTSPQPLYVDLHGEPYTYPEEPAVRYEERDGVTSGHGSVTARFPGMHGWFWLNTSEEPVEIELTVSGYYEKLEEVHRSSP